jgi:hypothetical protein
MLTSQPQRGSGLLFLLPGPDEAMDMNTVRSKGICP